MSEKWWIDDIAVPPDRILKFERCEGDSYVLHIDYFKALRRPVRVEGVRRKPAPDEPKQEYSVLNQEQILPDEGDAEQEPGLFLNIRRSN
ncbi:hypothetical protein KGY77_08090 [Candidatus Bipolaricaulota bacterium]|nr:hypothetical protein [Candidatus Bipolaricaulota bacterium]MBS3792585.1 hypothetical protein [Candidatus Bipolaricaulota bacterium]